MSVCVWGMCDGERESEEDSEIETDMDRDSKRVSSLIELRWKIMRMRIYCGQHCPYIGYDFAIN